MTAVVDIGPECFASADEQVISWRGRNYVPQTLEEHDTLAGIDVNDFTSTTTYGVFNDPQVWVGKFADEGGPIPDAMRELILETPLYEDEDGDRALRHAKLTNEDRRVKGTLDRDGMVLIKRQVVLKSPWILDNDEVGELGDVTKINLDTPRPR